MNIRMLAVTATVLSTLLFCTSARAADAPAVIEIFACNFVVGKTMSDLDKTVDFYQSQRSKMNSPAINKMRSVIWQSMRGRVPYDLIWLNTNLNLSEWGEATAALADTSAGQTVQGRFDEVLVCDASGIYTNDLLYQSEGGLAVDGEFVVESHRCKLNPGKSVADSDHAIDAWRSVFAKATASAKTSAVVLRRLPVISASGFDLNYVAAWDDVESYANGNSAYRMDPDSATVDARFAQAHVCESALFSGRVVAPPAD
jgi:hypothetical protein